MSIVNELVGKKVIIYSQGGGTERQDVGMLEAADDKFLRLRKSETETLYFGVDLVRIIKAFEF